ncbi:MAG: hypothetical protein IJ484_08220 [Oscillospiraceae bacterium]|nr:hypothetical protein [Oscillospiraceae bacterium]
MARPSKAAGALTRHATKAELEQRRAAENALLTGRMLKEQPQVKECPAAHREFRRVLPILTAIGKNDALYENVINRYCILRAECEEFEQLRAAFMVQLEKLQCDSEMDAETRYRLQAQMQKSILDADNRVQAKRKMMFDIEKECAMTVASALRSVPKTAQEKPSPLLALVNDV